MTCTNTEWHTLNQALAILEASFILDPGKATAEEIATVEAAREVLTASKTKGWKPSPALIEKQVVIDTIQHQLENDNAVSLAVGKLLANSIIARIK